MLAYGARSGTLHLRSVRVRGAADALRARRCMESALADVASSALDVSPQALLVVRRVAPAVHLRMDRVARAHAFGNAVQGELVRAARNAKRPWLQRDATSAEAVLFADEAELLACLVRDGLHGVLSERWWWPVLLAGVPAWQWVQRNLLTRGDVLPAVIEQLAACGDVVPWLATLSDVEVLDATTAVSAAHALNAVLKSTATVRPVVLDDGVVPNIAVAESTEGCATVVAAQRKLSDVVPELNNGTLTRAQQTLLALALGVQRASAWARSGEFALALQSVSTHGFIAHDAGVENPPRSPFFKGGDNAIGADLSATSASRSDSPPDVQGGVVPQATGGVPLERPPQPPQPLHPFGAPLLESEEGRKPVATPCVPDLDWSWASGETDSYPTERSFISHRASSLKGEEQEASARVRGNLAEPNSAPDSQVRNESNRSESVTAAPAVLPLSTSEFQCSVETQFGGVFYLLNVALALGLYGDFTQPRAPGIALSPWDWIALLGRAWFGRAFERDPVWAMLAQLAGRAHKQVPGADFVAPEAWSMPEDWLAPWGQVETLELYVTRDRLQLWHRAGFVLIDAPRVSGCAPLAQARELLAPYAMPRDTRLVRVYKLPRRGAQGAYQRGSQQRWLRSLLMYLEARLARALGADVVTGLPSKVCCHPAMLSSTFTRLDVRLTLATLPIELRIAGLDRNPGWIPAAGRTVEFHFS